MPSAYMHDSVRPKSNTLETGSTSAVQNSAGTKRRRPKFFAYVTLAAVMATGLTAAPAMAGQATAQAATPVAATPVAAAAKAKTTKTRSAIKVSRSSTRQIKGYTRVKLTVKVRVAGKSTKGTVKFYDGKKRIKTIKASSKAKSVRLSKNLKTGLHKIRIVFKPSSSKVASTRKTIRVRVISARDAVVKTAKSYTGTPYRFGGTTPRGFDCSGYTSYVYKKALGKTIERQSGGQRSAGKRISRSQAKPGDLIWSPGHVAIYLGGNKQIDAPRPGKSIKVRAIWQNNPTFIKVVNA